MSDRETDSGWRAEPEFELGTDDSIGPEPEAEFERMYRDQHAFVWRCARRMGVPTHDLDDVLQDTFVAAYRRFDSWDRESRPTTWLFGILRNVLRNRARGLRRHQRRIEALTRESAAPDEQGERLLASELLRNFLISIDEDKRAVFVLAELEGMTGNEIGRALEISPNTASSRLRLARQAFAEHFDHADTRRRVERVARRARERPEQPPAGAAERTLALVLVGPAPIFTASASGAGAGVLGLGKLVMIASAAVVALVVAPRLGASEREPAAVEATVVPVAAATSRSSRSGGSTADTSTPASEEPILVLAEAVERARPRGGAQQPAKPGFDLAGYEALQAAREHLIGKRPADALALLDSLDSSDPSLRAARAATQIAALCQLDRGDDARAIWSGLHASSPDSALVERLHEACWSR